MDDRIKKAFDFAADTTKQLLTLATGVLALTITFQEKISKNVTPASKWLLLCAWCAYLLSILFGVMTFMSLTGTLQPKESPPDPAPPPSIWASNVRMCSSAQAMMFLLGTVLVTVGAYWSA